MNKIITEPLDKDEVCIIPAKKGHTIVIDNWCDDKGRLVFHYEKCEKEPNRKIQEVVDVLEDAIDKLKALI